MSVPLRITFRNLSHSDAVEARIREKAQKLQRFSNLLTDAHVVVDAPHRHHHKGRTYHVAIELHLAGAPLVVNRDPGKDHGHEDVYVALRDAFDVAVRRLDEHVSKGRHEERLAQVGA